jgi:hypothetical protein
VRSENNNALETMMTLYAWKISSQNETHAESVSTLEELEAYLRASGLPMDRAPDEIIASTKLRQFEGQGVYKARTSAGDQWTLLWIELGRGEPISGRATKVIW